MPFHDLALGDVCEETLREIHQIVEAARIKGQLVLHQALHGLDPDLKLSDGTALVRCTLPKELEPELVAFLASQPGVQRIRTRFVQPPAIPAPLRPRPQPIPLPHPGRKRVGLPNLRPRREVPLQVPSRVRRRGIPDFPRVPPLPMRAKPIRSS